MTETELDDRDAFDLIEWRIEQATGTLNRVIPARFAAAQADHPQVAGWVRRYLDDPTGCPALVLSGHVGVGKTWQCWGAIKQIVTGRARQGLGTIWRATTHPDLNAEMRPKPDGSHSGALDRYLTADLLLFDDLGAGKQSEWTGDSLHRLVEYRWSQQLPTIYSTNLSQGALTEAVGDRVVSRLADTVKVPLKGEDRRWGLAA